MSYVRSRTATAAVAAFLIAYLSLTAVPASAHASRDSDHDGMPNRWEKVHGLNPNRAADAVRDADHDGLANIGEFNFGTDPQDADSDDDGVVDGDEDSNDDGIADGDEDGVEDGDGDVAGTIAAFDAATGLLTIDTSLGAQATGTVTADTELEWDDCDSEATTADLVPGTAVAELEFADSSTDLESVELVSTTCGDDEGDNNQGDNDEGDDLQD